MPLGRYSQRLVSRGMNEQRREEGSFLPGLKFYFQFVSLSAPLTQSEWVQV